MARSIQDFKALAAGKSCLKCSTPLSPAHLDHYPTQLLPSYLIAGIYSRQVIYVTCSKCQHDNYLDDLGIPTDPAELRKDNPLPGQTTLFD